MKKIMTLMAVGVFAFSLSAGNGNIETNNNEDMLKKDVCSVLITVDCEGDGVIDNSIIVDCEHVDAGNNMMYSYCL